MRNNPVWIGAGLTLPKEFSASDKPVPYSKSRRKRVSSKKWYALISILVVGSTVLGACAPAAPEPEKEVVEVPVFLVVSNGKAPGTQPETRNMLSAMPTRERWVLSKTGISSGMIRSHLWKA